MTTVRPRPDRCSALHVPNYRLFLAGQAISVVGIAVCGSLGLLGKQRDVRLDNAKAIDQPIN